MASRTGQGNNGGGPAISPSGQRVGYPGPNEGPYFRSERGFIMGQPPNTTGTAPMAGGDPNRGAMSASKNRNLRRAGQQPNARRPARY